jgi:hypothetical protein
MILDELVTVMDGLRIPVMTASYAGKVPDQYVVLTPMEDVFEIYADNVPHMDVCSVRISLFSKGNYLYTKDLLVDALMSAGFAIPLRRYIGREDDSGYHHYVIDGDKEYIIKE